MKLTEQQLREMGYVMVPDPCNPGRATWVKSKTTPLKHTKAPPSDSVVVVDTKTPKRIRQSPKPLMNNLEQEFYNQLLAEGKVIYAQSITFRLANGVRYTPDIFCFSWPWKGEDMPVAWEVKGPWMTDDAVVKLKVFAHAYPRIIVLLASKNKDTGLWYNQEVWG